MERVKYIGILAALIAVSCTGYTEPEVSIEADRTEIFADGVDAVNLSVVFMGNNVTADAVIRNSTTGERLEGNVFTTRTPGAYGFVALYDGYESYLPVTVTAREASLVLSTLSYSEEGSGETLTRTFAFGALYGTLDVSRDEGLTITESGSDEPLGKNAQGYYTVTTVGNEKKNIVGNWNGHTSLPLVAGPMRFYKKVGILEFTGTWCTWCPQLAGYIKDLETGYPDRNVMVAVHVNDALAVPYASSLVSRFKTAALPAAVLDFGDLVTNVTTSASDLERRIREIVEGNPARCGIAIASSVADGRAFVTVRLLSAATMEYGMAVALVENGIVHEQVMPPGQPVNYQYVHDHTLREVYQNNIDGVPVGEVAGGAQVERSFEFDLKDYNTQNCSIAVLATSGGKLMNAAECALGESIDFRYESDI